MPVDKNVKRTLSSSFCLTNLLLHMFVSRSPISLFPVVPRLGITLPDQYVSLCPMLVLHFPISLFPVASHVGVTLPYYGWGRDTDMGRNRKPTFLGA